MPGPRGGQVRLESRLDGNLVARFAKHDLAPRRCLKHNEVMAGLSRASTARWGAGNEYMLLGRARPGELVVTQVLGGLELDPAKLLNQG